MTKFVLILVANNNDAEEAVRSIFIKSINRASMKGFLYNGDPFLIRDKLFLEVIRGLELIAVLKSPQVKLTKEEDSHLRSMIR